MIVLTQRLGGLSREQIHHLLFREGDVVQIDVRGVPRDEPIDEHLFLLALPVHAPLELHVFLRTPEHVLGNNTGWLQKKLIKA